MYLKLSLKELRLKLSGFKTIAACLLMLNAISLAAIYSSSRHAVEFAGDDIFSRQMIWISCGWLLLIIFSSINYRSLYHLSYTVYAINILLLVAVHFFGKTVMGAQRWLSLFGFTFQPSEVSKIAIVALLARCFTTKQYQGFLKGFLLPLLLVLANAYFIFKQPDLGTALMTLLLFFAMGFFSKVPKRYFVICIVSGLLCLPLGFSMLKHYQKQRLSVFLNPNTDPLGTGYTIIQSKIAIGSGQITGKGFLAGTQNQFNFLPERHTDFIFTVVAEEWGFAGAIILLLLYWFILMKILRRASETRDEFAYYLCLGIAILFFLHILVNIGMTLGIFPVVGIPLIFLSYGGTNLLINFMLMGVFLNICQETA